MKQDNTQYAYFLFFNPLSMELTVYVDQLSVWVNWLSGEATTIWGLSVILMYHHIL